MTTQLFQPFDARNFDPTQGAGALPVGKHPVIIYEGEIEENSNKNGGFLKLMLKITDGPNAGQTGAYRLNLYHNNPQTVEIAHRQLSALCYVTGVFQVTDARQLFNIPFIVEVGMQKGEEAAAKGYTEIKKVYDRNGVEPKGQQPAGGQGQQPQQQQPQGFGGQPQGQQQPAQGGGAAWGGQPQGQGQTPAPAANPPAAWGNPAQGQQPAQQQPQGQNPAWGAAPAQQPAAGGGAGGGQWQQQQQPQGAAPWGR